MILVYGLILLVVLFIGLAMQCAGFPLIELIVVITLLCMGPIGWLILILIV